MNWIVVLNALIDSTLLVAPNLLPLVVKDEQDRLKAELYLALLKSGLGSLRSQLIEVLEGITDPSTINLDELFNEDFDAVLARLKAERGQA